MHENYGVSETVKGIDCGVIERVKCGTLIWIGYIVSA